MEGLLNLMTGISIVLILMVMISVRRMHVRVEYAVSWFGASLTLLVLSRSHVVLTWLAGWLGIQPPALALITLVGCVFLIVVFRLSVVVSGLKDANIALAQRVAILEFHLKSLNEKQEAQI